MLLRDHSLMSYHGLRNWPPVWNCIGRLENTHAKGEVGILKGVTLSNIGSPIDATSTFIIKDHRIACCYSTTTLSVVN
jgi:hypothetical protein